MISAVFPAYNEEENVAELHRRLVAALDGLGEPYEIIAVDDGSTDGTFKRLSALSPLRIISLARNVGQAAALDAGIKAARGDVIVTIDADLQDDPEDIGKLVAKLNEGYDVVSGWRCGRTDPLFRRLFSRAANALTGLVMGVRLHDFAGPLKAIRRPALDGVALYGGMHSFLPAVLAARGARVAEVPVRHSPRRAGLSKYGPAKLFALAADLLVVKFMADYLARPFRFFGGWGLFAGFLGLAFGVAAIVLKLLDIRDFTQTPLPTLTALFVVLGALLVMMGFIAELLLRIYYETRGRTPYVVKSVVENNRR